MASLFGLDLGVDPASFVSGSSFGTMFTISALIFVIAIIAGIGIWIWNQKKIYSKTVINFENISGAGYSIANKDVARLVKVGDGGEEILYLKRAKEYRTAYGKKMGKNQYWFAKGQDGYFYNIVLGDLDAKMGMLDIEPIDRDMRYMHVAIRKNIQDRYKKVRFMDKYGSWIMGGLMMIIFFIGMGFMLDQIGNLIGETTSAMSSIADAVESMKSIAAHLDTVCSGGTGIR